MQFNLKYGTGWIVFYFDVSYHFAENDKVKRDLDIYSITFLSALKLPVIFGCKKVRRPRPLERRNIARSKFRFDLSSSSAPARRFPSTFIGIQWNFAYRTHLNFYSILEKKKKKIIIAAINGQQLCSNFEKSFSDFPRLFICTILLQVSIILI